MFASGWRCRAGSADIFFLLGISDADALRWIDRQSATRPPTAIFVKQPSAAVVARAVEAGTAVVAVEPQARWERLYRLVNHVFDHHGDRADPLYGSGTDLFGLAQSIADRTHGMVSIEDEQSHVLAYSASNDEADELRRSSILGRAGPPDHLQWIAQWGIFDALRSRPEVVSVDERPELGLRPRLAIGIHQPAADERHPLQFAGTIWVQQGSRPLAEDSDEVLRGAAVLAARIMARLAATPSGHAVRIEELLGLREGSDEPAAIARDLGIDAVGRAAVIGVESSVPHHRLADVLALSASAFHRDAQVAAAGQRVYLLFPSGDFGVQKRADRVSARRNRTADPAAVTSWIRGVVGTLRSELGLELRAVIAAPIAGLTQVAAARGEVDRVLDSASRHPGAIGQVTTLAEARTTVQLDEIVSVVANNPRFVDPRLTRTRSDVHPDTAGLPG